MGTPAGADAFTFTGQRTSDIGLYFYNARWMDSSIGHFTQPDVIVTDPYNPLSYDRYAYVNSNPINFNDPTGHMVDTGCGKGECGDAHPEDYTYFTLHYDAQNCKNGAGGGCPDYLGIATFTVSSLIGISSAPEVLAGLYGLSSDSLLYLSVICTVNQACLNIFNNVSGVGEPVTYISTPQGLAEQGTSQVELAAREIVQNGSTLYKLGTLGPSKGIESQYWSLENPLTVQNYAYNYGIPSENLTNSNQFLLIGQLRENVNFITRYSPGTSTNLGGAIEVVVEEFGVMIKSFFMP